MPAHELLEGPRVAGPEPEHEPLVALQPASADPARWNARAPGSICGRSVARNGGEAAPRPPRAALLALCGLLLAAPAGARASGAGDDLYRIHPAADLALSAASLAIAGIPYALPHLITPSCPCDPSSVNRLDRIAIGHHSAAADLGSDAAVAAAVLAPPLADALWLGRGGAILDDLAVFGETLAVNSGLVVIAKYAARRPLPVTYEGDPGYVRSQRGYRSFYSGHTSLAVSGLTAAAWTLRWREGDRGWPWAVVAAAGAGVGTLRVLAGRHFPTDVLAGAVAGFAVGTAVPWLHLRRGPHRLTLVPLGTGAALAGTF